MGTTFSFDNLSAFASPIRRKRKREDDDPNNSPVGKDLDLQKPKRKRSQSTSKYIYQTLFLDGQGSDVTIVALGKEWHLHKVYLCQCAYFASMFSGSWTESSLKTITVSIPDDCIDENALKITFGSLYTDTVFIKPVNVTRVLAAANLFQLEGLIQQCALIMKEKISEVTVCSYYTAADTYGQQEVKNQCVVWLEKNMLSSKNVDLLREISPDLMTALVSSHRLFVVQVEMNIYSLLKRWMFLQLNRDWKGDASSLDKACDTFYLIFAEGKHHFLEQSVGRQFIGVFSAIRWQHVVCDVTCLNLIQQDRIVPLDWLRPVFQYQWLHMLQVDQGYDKGPAEDMSLAMFDDLCVRCGRVLEKEGQFCWRWTGYNFGFDLIISFAHRIITLRRNTMRETCPNAVSLQDHRKVFYRLTALCLDEMGQTKHQQTTGIQHTALGKDEEKVIMICQRELEFPLHLKLNLMFVTPLPSLTIPKLSPLELGVSAVDKHDVCVQVRPSELDTATPPLNYLLSKPGSSQTTCTSPLTVSRETQTTVTENVNWRSEPVLYKTLRQQHGVLKKSKSDLNTHKPSLESESVAARKARAYHSDSKLVSPENCATPESSLTMQADSVAPETGTVQARPRLSVHTSAIPATRRHCDTLANTSQTESKTIRPGAGERCTTPGSASSASSSDSSDSILTCPSIVPAHT